MTCWQIWWAHCRQMEDLPQRTVGKVGSQDAVRRPGYLDQTLYLGGIGAVQRIHSYPSTAPTTPCSVEWKGIPAVLPPLW
jgi:hypothetical protein